MKYVFIIHFLLFSFVLYAQIQPPKREFRGVWIATVSNIDWPSKAGLSTEQQQYEFTYLLDILQRCKMNAIVVQIRPCADAFYKSLYEPWSKYLTGVIGTEPFPYYDPLEFMITEAHKRGLEFHAWFNPYRALTDATKNNNPTNHITHIHPEWFINYGGKKLFDPALPEVQTYVQKIILDVVSRYDIDAVHMDDYFYPYRDGKREFPDYKSYAKYGTSFTNKDDWRRNNVNQFIEVLNKKIKAIKPYVKFGISPFGVWRNNTNDPNGSNTTAGQTNYDDLFADVITWLKNGWIDYVMPQLYWEIGHKAADYDELIHWWSTHTYNRNLYIGHAAYQIGTSTKPCWRNLNELNTQIELSRNIKNVNGSCYYSANAFLKNYYGLIANFEKNIYAQPSLLPLMPWLKKQPIYSPVLKSMSGSDGYKLLNWTVENPSSQALQYAVYRFSLQENIDIENSSHLLDIVRTNYFVDKTNSTQKYKYVVTTLDRLHNESTPSNWVQ